MPDCFNLISDPEFLEPSEVDLVSSDELPPLVKSENIQKIPNLTREDFVVKRIFDDIHLQQTIAEHLSPELFSDKYKRVCMGIKSFNEKFNRFPSAAELLIGFPDNAPERKDLISLMEAPVDSIASDVSGNVVKNFFKEKISELAILDAIQCVRGNSVENLPLVIEKLEKGINFTLGVDIGLSARRNMNEIIERLNKSFVAIPSALDEICAATASDEGLNNGGWYKGLSIYMGMPNVGKTIMLCNEAAYAYRHGYNVLYISLEMDEEFIHQRIISNVCKIRTKNVKQNSASDILKKFEDNAIINTGDLIVKRMPTSTTVNDIDNVIRQIQKSTGKKIDFLVVDYLGIMKPVRRANTIQNMNMYLMGKEVAEQLRDLGCKYSIPVLSASQLNRDGYSNLEASLKDTAGSAGLNDTADFICTITQNEALRDGYPEIGSMYHHTILKSRFGKNNVQFDSVVEYEEMRVRSLTIADHEIYAAKTASQIFDMTVNPSNTVGKSSFVSNVQQTKMNVGTKQVSDLHVIENKKNTVDVYGGM